MFAGSLYKIKKCFVTTAPLNKHKCWCEKQRKLNSSYLYYTPSIMPAKKLYLFKQILEVKAAHLFQCVGTHWSLWAIRFTGITVN